MPIALFAALTVVAITVIRFWSRPKRQAGEDDLAELLQMTEEPSVWSTVEETIESAAEGAVQMAEDVATKLTFTPATLDVPWYSQYDSANVPRAGDSACYRAALAMLRAVGVSVSEAVEGHYIPVAVSEDAQGGVITTEENVAAGRAYIDEQLGEGRPVIIGLSHQGLSYNADRITDHFVVITGRGLEDGRVFYSYNDPATDPQRNPRAQEIGTTQRLYLNDVGNLWHDGPRTGAVVYRHSEMSMVIINA